MIGIETNRGQQSASTRLDALRLPSLEARNHSDILFDAQMVKQTDFLDNVADAAAEPNWTQCQSGFAVHFRWPFCGIDQTVDQFHCRGFAATSASEQHQCLPAVDFQAEI